ncbi:hypothetical protein B0H16DRAFT_1415528 [Mycena metata]|uniref:Serine/threonine-protein kinase Tel1 n=1 Tax=Mycena metata TaxID=1033252 RepID=A0AAD7JA75_9AGAR|nr:hypothetical protein B0H16DRAFT_1415528 [Mycena metata]
MSSKSTVKGILRQLQSDKITERQQGLQGLRQVFSLNHVVARFHISETGNANPQAWLVIFQALFSTVRTEKEAYSRQLARSSATTTIATVRRRLTDAANTVRWLTERTAQYMDKKAMQCVFDHLSQSLRHNSTLLEPVALDYIKALRSLLEWGPHLDRLDEDRWLKLVEFGFNLVLGDNLRTSFSDDPPESVTSPRPPPEADDSEFFLENEDSDTSSVASPSKKRRRRAATVPPGPSSRRRPQRDKVPSKEQNEIVPILNILLRSSNAPLLIEDAKFLPSSILSRLQRFLEIYPPEASLYHDYLCTVLSTLSHLSLNRKDSVVRFAQASWDSLVGLWGTKNKGMKECLVAVLHMLFPFLTASHDKSPAAAYDWSSGISQLWRLLDGEAESRWGVDGLSLECLRLELADPEETAGGTFLAPTFRAGSNFDGLQAVAWAILELQADCAEKLFEHSENTHSLPTQPRNKRNRVENPISSLLDSMQQQSQSHVRAYHLQTLLFFVERHWSVLHDTLQQTVFSTLVQFISFDDPLVQSWTFLCFAAIAHSDMRPSAASAAPTTRDWDTIWTHAIRRTNVPSVSRAACHTAYVLLVHSHSHFQSSSRLALTPQRLLVEIESLAKDLDVQGPPLPSDSVCAFISQALRIASQDARLYRMQFEEKALSWLVDCWAVRDAGNLPLHLVRDMMLLLESICGLSKRSDLFCRVLLPECLIVETLVAQRNTKVIRDYLLTATLPEFRKVDHRPVSSSLDPPTAADDRRIGDDPVEESPREKKISTFLLKSLESLASDLELIAKSSTLLSAEKARKSLDWAIVALSFESLLGLNGTRPNRRVIQAACKVMLLVTPLLQDPRWTDAEKALVILALEPLTSTGDSQDDDIFSTGLLPPEAGSGIKAETLQSLLSHRGRQGDIMTRRLDLQRLICKSTDVQDGFDILMATLRNVLRILVDGHNNDADDHVDMDFQTTAGERTTDNGQQAAASTSVRCIAEVAIAFLTVTPILRSVSGELTNDKELTKLALECAETPVDTSLLIFRIFLRHVQQKTLALSKANFDAFLDELASKRILLSYLHAKNDNTQRLVVQFLDSTLHIWCGSNGERGSNVRYLCSWLSKALAAGQESRSRIRSWQTRDALARFYDRYLLHDPSEASWYKEEDDNGYADGLPTLVLPLMNRDDDIRVRFRAGVLNAHLFAVGRSIGRDATTVYDPIFQTFPQDLDNYENMLTRILCLGNMMIVCSATRRGAYWHLLEGSLYTTRYSLHTEAVLVGVSQRLGLPKFAALFEAYASQLAYTIRLQNTDFLRLPPRLLGYIDRRGCAEANFIAFTPTNLVADAPQQTAHVGRKLFEGHCKVIQKPVSEGIRDCFADIVGFQILQALLSLDAGQMVPTDELEAFLLEKTMMEEDPTAFRDALRDNIDGVVTWIVRTLGDQDFRSQGPIINALEVADNSGKMANVFRALVCHRSSEDFETHTPNVPAFPAATVLQALVWFDSFVPDTDAGSTAYHVAHKLFAEIQRSPLVNEQIRLINALCLFIAFRHESFQDPTLLHTLIRGATSLMAQSDLARAAQSVLEWVFDCYRTTRADNPRFPDVLIRISCFANDYARQPPESPFYSLGNNLRTWIDGQVLLLSTVKSKSLKAYLIRALSAWPHTPSPQLSDLARSITSENLSTVLSDPSIVSNKFRLVRRLQEHAVAADRDRDQFAETDFWRLRECIPSSEQLQDADIDAFANLLEIHEGHISSFDRGSPASRGTERRDAASLPQDWIVHRLLTMLEASNGAQVYISYQTLRSIMSVCPPNISTKAPIEYRDELRYLQAYKRIPKTRSARSLEELSSDVYLEAVGDFPRWVGMVATLLSDILSADEPFFAQLTLILQSDASFTEQTLPVLVHSVLENERSSVTSKQPVSDLSCRKTLSSYFAAVLESGRASTPVMCSIVDIVLHLRNFAPLVEKDATKTDLKKVDALSYDKWLAIDYTLLARSSLACGSYTTSLLFLELAAEYSKGDPDDAAPILYEIYSHIDEPDGFYGIKTKNLHQFLVKRFHHERQWDKAFRFHSAALEAGSTDAVEADGLLQSFHSFGFHHLAIDTLQSSSFSAGATFTPGMNYRLGWRTETWDLPERPAEGNPGSPLYNALRAVHRARSPRVIQSVVRSAISDEIGRLRALGSENVAEIRDAAQNLMCLNQVSQWFAPKRQAIIHSRQADSSEWKEFTNLGKGFGFSDFENVMATRISLVRSVRRKEERQQIGTLVSPFSQCLLDVEKQCLIKLSEAARDAQQVQIALNSVTCARKLERSPSVGVTVEFANVLRLHKEEKLAVQFLKDADLTHLPPNEKAVIFARLGTWTAEARLENPTSISDSYFKPATALASTSRKDSPARFDDSHARVYHQYASFAERQYKAINNSPDALRWRVYVDRKTQEIEFRKTQGQNKSLHDARVLLQTDQELFRKHNKAREGFLADAIEMYSRALEASDAFDGDGAIRLCSLWFENFDETEFGFQDTVQAALARVPSRKLVFLAHQLSARLSKTSESTKNQENLESVVLRMCIDHPFHSLYQVYCLLPYSELPAPPTDKRQSSRHSTPILTPPNIQATARSEAASVIFDRLRGDPGCANRIKDVELVATACLEWAKFPIIKKHKAEKEKGTLAKTNPIPPQLAIRNISNVDVPVLTCPPALDPSCKYDNCVFIKKFETTYDTAGGVNLPKVCICVGTDGERYKQLFKGEGNDDLRQDAVMEQVFTLVNTVLQGDRETNRRSLNVRGYVIVPLGAQAGVLEFVVNTTPMQQWLQNAHLQYNKSDWTPALATRNIQKAYAEHGGPSGSKKAAEPDKLLERYLQIKEHFHPVMRHFFTEKHKQPMAWFAMRLNYIRSVATTSIVGHILGLGDRHGSNILLDTATGEVVHIDLGIAFDQGKLLTVPEQVPFRMTSDVVDGMGAAGTQGVFQRCAEETLRVLREGSEVIMTVLEVFKHDPLHSWTASDVKLKNVQKDVDGAGPTGGAVLGRFRTGLAGIGIDMASGTADEAADRALSGVARKLDKAMSVEYTVNELIAEATDPMRLATIWYGWGAIY